MTWTKPNAATWIDLINARAQANPNAIAIRFLANGEDETQTLTFAELHAESVRIGAALQPLSDRGTRAVILLPNNVSFITTFFGCIYAGFIPVPGYPPRANRNKDRISKVLKQCGARLIIGDENLDRNEIMGNLSNLGFRGVRFVGIESYAGARPSDWKDPALNAEDIAFLQYTSGSTSDPKGVCLTHGNLLSNLEMLQKSFALHQKSQIVSWLPLYHDMGLIGAMLMSVYMGIPFTFMPPAAFVQKPLRWIRAIAKYRATMTGGPNFSYDLCVSRYKAEELAEVDLSCVETLFNGAEPIRRQTLEQFARTYVPHGFTAPRFFPCYGLAEGSLFVSGGPAGSGFNAIDVSKAKLQKGQVAFDGGELVPLVSSGKVAEGLDVQIVDPDSLNPRRSLEVGEILINGPSISAGYWDSEVKNRETFGLQINDRPVRDRGYLRTGDLGFVHQGHLFVTGRIKDVIIAAGQNHYPQDLELTAQTKSPVASIAAAFVIDDKEKIGLLIEVGRTQLQSDFDKEALTIARAIGLEHELAVSRIAFVGPGELPRTSSGKVQRQLTRKKLLEGSFTLLADWTTDPQAAATPAADARVTATGARPGTTDVQIKKEWIRAYCARRLNLGLAHGRKTFPPNLILELGNQGLLGMIVPKADGGLGFKYREFVDVLEQLAAIDISLSIFVGLNNVLGIQPIVTHAGARAKRDHLGHLARGRTLAGFAITERGAGSNPKGITTQVVRSGGQLKMTGEKIWIGLASWSSHLCVFAKELNENGASLGISAFLLDTDQPGITVGPEAMTMGVQPIVQNSIAFNDVIIDESQRLGDPGKGLAVAFEIMNLARFSLLSVSTGAMKRCYQLLERHSRDRRINTGVMADNGLVFNRLSEFAYRITALEKLSRVVSDKVDSGQVPAEELFMVCKAVGPEFAWEVVDSTMQLLGGRGYLEPNDLPQMLRDARLLRIFEGPTEAISYHLGAALMKNGIQNLSSEPVLDAKVLTDLDADIKQMKDQAQSNADVRRHHVIACGLGEMAGVKILEAIVGADPAAAWLNQRYQAVRQRVLTDIKRFETNVDPGLAAQRYAAEVGLVITAGGGEEWTRTLESSPGIDPTTTEQPAQSLSAVTGAAKTASNMTVPLNEAVSPPAVDVRPVEAPPVEVARPTGRPAAPPSPVHVASPAAAATAPPPNDVQAIRAFLKERITALRPVLAGRMPDDVPFAALGIDSIAAIELALEIDERYGLSMPDTLVWDYPTIAEASDFIATSN